MKTALPERIAQARELAGKSKTELADALNVTVAAVSQWENGSKTPSPDNLVALSRELKIGMHLLITPVPPALSPKTAVTFRARSAVKTGILRRQATRFAELAAEAFLWLERWIAFPIAILPEIQPGVSPEHAARECRRFWGLGDRPILKLGELFESKGIRLCTAGFGDVRFDAYSCVINGRPFVFLGDEKNDRSRSRFDAGHELGHLVMHHHFSDEELIEMEKKVEKQADEFASAFLMPEDSFAQDVVDSSLDGFVRLKPKWGVSVQAMVRRAWDLKLISEETYNRHLRNMSVRLWRRAQGEPLDDHVPMIARSFGKKSIELLSRSNKIKPWEIPSELPLPDAILKSVFDTDLRAMVPEELSNVIVLKDFSDVASSENVTSKQDTLWRLDS